MSSTLEAFYNWLKKKFAEHLSQRVGELTTARPTDECYKKTMDVFYRECTGKLVSTLGPDSRVSMQKFESLCSPSKNYIIIQLYGTFCSVFVPNLHTRGGSRVY